MFITTYRPTLECLLLGWLCMTADTSAALLCTQGGCIDESEVADMKLEKAVWKDNTLHGCGAFADIHIASG